MKIQIQTNKKLYKTSLQNLYGQLCRFCYVCLLLLIPTILHANRLVLSTPDTAQVSTQNESSLSDSGETSDIEFKKSTTRDAKNEISTAKWSNEEGFELTSKYQENVLDLRNATSDKFFSNATWNSKIKLPINDFLSAKGEFNIGKFTPQYTGHSPQFDNQLKASHFNERNDYYQVSQDLSNSFITFGLKGKTSLMNYGLDYSSIGSDYETFDKKINKRDRAGFKYWASKSFNDLTLETSYSTLWNNLNKDREILRMTDDLIGIKASYTLSSWPYSSVSVGYQAGRQESSLEPTKKQYYSGDISIMSADFYMSGEAFSVSLGSSMEQTNDNSSSSGQKLIYNYISASYFSSGVYITPSFYTSDTYFNNSNYSYKSLGSSLSLSYIPTKSPYNLSFYVSHDRNKSNDQFILNNSISAGVSLNWKIKLSKKDEQIFTFRIENYSYLDQVYTSSNNSDFFAGVSWRLVDFN